MAPKGSMNKTVPAATTSTREAAQWRRNIWKVIGMIIVLVACASSYAYTIFQGVPGGDSGELAAMACALGTAHPPGYPLLMLLGHVVFKLQELLNLATPILWLNVFNACIAVAANVNLYLFIFEVLGTKTDQLLHATLSCIGAVTFAFHSIVWEYATGFEVFSLNNLLCVMLLRQSARCIRRPGNDRHIQIGAFLCGLGMTNQHTIILFAIPLIISVLYVRYMTSKPLTLKVLASYAGAFLLGILPCLQLVFSSSMAKTTRGSWGNPGGSVALFMRHLARMDYGTFRLFPSQSTPIPVTQRLNAYFVDVAENQLPNKILLVGLIVGLTVPFMNLVKLGSPHVTKSIQLRIVIVFTLAFYVFVFNGLSNMPLDEAQPHLAEIRKRFWQQPFILICALSCFGLSSLFHFVRETCLREIYSQKVRTVGCGEMWKVLPALVIISLVSVTIGLNTTSTTWTWWKTTWDALRIRSSSTVLQRYSKGILGDNIANNSIVLITGDLEWTLGLYEQHCASKRSDITLLHLQTMSRGWFSAYHSSYSTIQFPGSHLTFHENSNSSESYTLRSLLDSMFAESEPRTILFTGDPTTWPASANPYELVPYETMLRVCPPMPHPCAGVVALPEQTDGFTDSRYKGSWEWFARLRYWQRLKYNWEYVSTHLPNNPVNHPLVLASSQDSNQHTQNNLSVELLQVALNGYERLIRDFPDLVVFSAITRFHMPVNAGVMAYQLANALQGDSNQQQDRIDTMMRALAWWRDVIRETKRTQDTEREKHPSFDKVVNIVENADAKVAVALLQGN